MKSVDELGQQEGLFSIIDLQHDLPTEWHKAINSVDPNDPTKPKVMYLSKLEQFIPFYATAYIKTLKATDIVLVTDITEDGFKLFETGFNKGAKVGELETNTLSGQDLEMKNWKLTLPKTIKADSKLWMVVRFKLN